MKLQYVGCSHHHASVEVREQLAFSPQQAEQALQQLRQRFPLAEAVLLSTCNRVELYTASEHQSGCPSRTELVEFLAEFHGLRAHEILPALIERHGEEAVKHLFTTAASLDSMVIGEAQILSQVKQAYELANVGNCTGPLTHAAFQAAIRVARRVARETAIHEKRVSIPSVAVVDYARQFFERFDDKRVLVIGAGEMGEETLRYLLDEHARDITIVNRNPERAERLARSSGGVAKPWDQLDELLVQSDLVISTTGATQPIVDAERYRHISPRRYQRPLFILDLAVPRDFTPEVGEFLEVYLYSIDDLQKACDKNRKAREREWPKAERIIDEEARKFIAEMHHRSTGPWIRRLKSQAEAIKQEEFTRLQKKLGDLDARQLAAIDQSLDRLVNKLLHPPLESLRDHASQGTHHGLLDALKRLFNLPD